MDVLESDAWCQDRARSLNYTVSIRVTSKSKIKLLALNFEPCCPAQYVFIPIVLCLFYEQINDYDYDYYMTDTLSL